MKIVINREFGGFGLSDKAFERLLERKGIEFETSTKYEMTHYWQPGHVGDDDFYISHYDFYENRSDPDLIAVIEELGEEVAGGRFASLRIVDIPDDVKWHIHEYDGLEHVAEDHRTWS